MVEPVEIVRAHLARAQMRDVDAVARRRPRCARRSGGSPGMPVAGAGAVDLDVEPEPLRLGPERRLGERRAADIAQADEQDRDRHRGSDCLVAKARRSASQMQREAQREGRMATIVDEAAPAAARPRIGAYAWYALFVLVLVYIVNFIDRQILSILVERHQARPQRLGRPDRLPLRHRLRRLLRPVRHPARAARRQLVSRPADGDGPRALVVDDRLVRLRQQLRHARRRPDRRRHRRGERLARRLFDDLRQLPQGAARHRSVDLFERPLYRRRAQPADRRPRRQPLERRLSRSRRPRRSASPAGRPPSSRSACPACCSPCGC